MSRAEFIEQLVRQAGQLLNTTQIQQDAEAKLRVLFQGAFNRMDLVTRDEFDAQVAVLNRTRAKVEKLERELAELIKRLEF